MELCGGRQTRLGTTAKAAALAALLALTACATEPVNDDSGRFVEMPGKWETIELAEADLTLPLVAPLEIASLRRRVDESHTVEDVYAFQGIEGYVKTTRTASGIYPEAYANQLRAGKPRSNDFIAGLSLPSADKVIAFPYAFLNGKSRDGRFLSRGFTADGSAPPYHDDCFVARTAYLMVDLTAIERTEDAVDTVVEVLLCGKLPKHTALVQMLMQVEVVRDRLSFREALSRHTAISN